MANSGQNFLNLVFPQINRAIDTARGEQGQRADLLLTLQQMMQRRSEVNADEAFRQKQFGLKEREFDMRNDAISQLPEELRSYVAAGVNPSSAIQEKAAGIKSGGSLPASIIQEYQTALAGGFKGNIGEYYKSTRGGGDNLLSPSSLARFSADYQKLVSDYDQKRMVFGLLKDKVPGIAEPSPPPATFGEYLTGILDAAKTSMSDDDLAKLLEGVLSK